MRRGRQRCLLAAAALLAVAALGAAATPLVLEEDYLSNDGRELLQTCELQCRSGEAPQLLAACGCRRRTAAAAALPLGFRPCCRPIGRLPARPVQPSTMY